MRYQLAEQSSNSGLKSLLILVGLGLVAWLSCKYLWPEKAKKKSRKNPEEESIPVVVEDDDTEVETEVEEDDDEDVKELSKLYRRY